MPKHPNAYVRVAKVPELPAVADVLTRAFLNDPTMCYYGCVPALVADPLNPTPEDQETIRGLHIFQSAVMARAPLLVGGNVDVVVIPIARSSASSKGTASPEQEAEEEIVAVALWLPPRVTLDLKQAREARARAEPGSKPKVGLTWGPTGKKRLAEYAPFAEGVLAREFAARARDRLNSWHVFAIAVDPAHQGSGYSSMLFAEGFRRASPKPIHLTASKPQNKNIYEHFGFELVEAFTVGAGEVDANGLEAQGEAATGLQEFVMIKASLRASFMHRPID
ncbi:hypothetical protein V8D89_001534 [Ganoderma adspersum]